MLLHGLFALDRPLPPIDTSLVDVGETGPAPAPKDHAGTKELAEDLKSDATASADEITISGTSDRWGMQGR